MKYFSILLLLILTNCSSIQPCTYFDEYKKAKGKAKLIKSMAKEEIRATLSCKF